jgi:hypothetical protein
MRFCWYHSTGAGGTAAKGRTGPEPFAATPWSARGRSTVRDLARESDVRAMLRQGEPERWASV